MATHEFGALQEQVHREHEARHQALVAQLETRARRSPARAAAWADLGVARLAWALAWAGPSALPAAQLALERAVALDPADAVTRAYLGRCLDAQDCAAPSLAVFIEAAALAPGDAVLQAAVATLAAESGDPVAARPLVESAARASGLPVPGPRDDLRHWVRNSLVHARNHLDSRLRKAADKLESRFGGRPLEELMALELAETRKVLKKEVPRSRVPAAWRHLVPWAQRLGVGDDGLRALAASELDAAEWARLEAELAPHDPAITAWIDGCGSPLPEEAAAFQALQLAVEEARGARGI